MKLDELELTGQQNEVNPFYISLSDLMILLSVFFLMIISISKIDKGSFEKMRASVTGSKDNTLVALAEDLKRIVEGTPGVPGVAVRLAKDGVRLDLDTTAIFELGSAVLKPDVLDPLRPILKILLETEYKIDVEGHTDDQPLFRTRKGEIVTNWSLSGRRASAVIHAIETFGFAPTRVRIVGYADTKPKVSIEDKHGELLEVARAENRRVTLLIR